MTIPTNSGYKTILTNFMHTSHTHPPTHTHNNTHHTVTQTISKLKKAPY